MSYGESTYTFQGIYISCYTFDTCDVEGADEFADWYETLSPEQQDAVTGRIELLQARGPRLRRPVEIQGSAYAPQMKELRCSKDGAWRVLFIFDPRRTAILLLGGDKEGQWEAWYRQAIPQADRLYEIYLDDLRISRIEHQTDLYVSTLARYITAMGGRIEIIATFDNNSTRVPLALTDLTGDQDVVVSGS